MTFIISEMQHKLATWAATEPSRRIEQLQRLITQPEWLAEAARITLASKGTYVFDYIEVGSSATVISTASVRRPLNRPRREDRICLRLWSQSINGAEVSKLSVAIHFLPVVDNINSSLPHDTYSVSNDNTPLTVVRRIATKKIHFSYRCRIPSFLDILCKEIELSNQ